jgi:CubicO group peptidase (beta-lactamase class C family)
VGAAAKSTLADRPFSENRITLNKHYWPTQNWRDENPESMGMRADLLSNLEREIKARYRGVQAFLIVRRGYLVFERYFGKSGPDDKHPIASVTKSFISALIGIAIDRGFIEGVHQRVLGFFPEFVPGASDHLKHRLTIEHLLTMTAGFQWRTGQRAYEPLLDRMRRSENWVSFILNLPVRERSFGTFQYNSTTSHLLSAIITRSTGCCAQAFASEHLLEPLGIDPPATDVGHSFSQADVFRNAEGVWPKDPQGNTIGGWGLVLKARDMARFGYLYLSGGRWDGRQIISKKWIEDSILPHTPSYGYQWWLRDVNGVFVFAAVGRGGHHIFCLPQKDMVVVVASKPSGRWRDRWPLLENFAIPAVVR